MGRIGERLDEIWHVICDYHELTHHEILRVVLSDINKKIDRFFLQNFQFLPKTSVEVSFPHASSVTPTE